MSHAFPGSAAALISLKARRIEEIYLDKVNKNNYYIIKFISKMK